MAAARAPGPRSTRSARITPDAARARRGSLRPGPGPLLAAAVLAATTGTAGCSYVSDYVPPNDGRARVVWRENRIVPILAGAPLSPPCARAIEAAARVDRAGFEGRPQPPRRGPAPPPAEFPRLSPAQLAAVRQGDAWVPRYFYYVDVDRRTPFEFRPPPVYLSSLLGTQQRRPLPYSPDVLILLLQIHPGRPYSMPDERTYYRSEGLLRSSVHFVAKITANLLAPFIGFLAIYPAFDPAGDAQGLMYAVNQVNAYNDLARAPGTACSYANPPAPPPLPAAPPQLPPPPVAAQPQPPLAAPPRGTP